MLLLQFIKAPLLLLKCVRVLALESRNCVFVLFIQITPETIAACVTNVDSAERGVQARPFHGDAP